MNSAEQTPAPADLRAKVRALMDANRLNEYTALRYVERIAGHWETDAIGKAVVRDELGRELARVIVPPSEDTPDDSRRGKGTRRSPAEAEIVTREGRLLPVITHGPRLYAIETKPTLLDIGIAAMQPLTPELTEDSAAPIEFRATLPADPAAGRMADTTLAHFTHHPIIAALARRFYVVATLGEAEEGPLTISSEDIGS